MRLQKKILLVLIPSLVLPMLGLGLMAYVQLRQTAEQKTLSQMSTLMRQIELQLHSYVQTAQANVELFASADLITRYMLVDDEAMRYELLQAPVLSLLSSYQHAYPQYYELRLLLTDGYEDTRSTLRMIPNVTEEEGETGYFRRMQASGLDSYREFFLNPDTEEYALLVARRIELKDPSRDPVLAELIPRGYLAITSDLDFLREQQQRNRIGTSGRLLFTDAAGNLLFTEGVNAEPETLPEELFWRLVDHATGQKTYNADYQGEPTIFQGRQLDENLYLFASLPEHELLAVGHRLGALVAGITIATALCISALLFGLLRSLIIKPIKKLGQATHDISQGNLDVAVQVDRRDEIGDLATAFDDMSKNLQQSANQIQYLAYHDSLTGLPNRYMFTRYLERAIHQCKRGDRILALLFLDLDDFKRVNDTLGHEAGDLLLQELAERVTKCVRRGDYVARAGSLEDTVARLGGDEFVVLLTETRSIHDVAKAAQRILDRVSEPFTIRHHTFHVGTSIGITTFPADGEDAETLIKNADVAMYHAKDRGKNNYHYFSESMNEAALQRFTLENALRNAIGTDQLKLYYQPIVAADSLRLEGVEALIRWEHPEMGFLAPDAFIPLAEETGLILPMGEWVLRQACRQAVAWAKAGYEPVNVSVNISNRQFSDQGLDETVKTVLAETGLSPQYLELEVTESCIMQVQDHGLDILKAIRSLGVRVSMDDFGTGYSSLSSLRHLPVDTLKIDRSFVDGVTAADDDAAIISMIFAMARILKLSVTAEGVETEGQLEFLRRAGCDKIQGYLISRPVPAAELERFLQPKASEAPPAEGILSYAG